MKPVYPTCLPYSRKYLDIQQSSDKSVIKQKSKTANNPLNDQKSRNSNRLCE